MLRYKTKTRPGLVAFYIRPGNGAGLFLQPRSLHGVTILTITSSVNASQQSIIATNLSTKLNAGDTV